MTPPARDGAATGVRGTPLPADLALPMLPARGEHPGFTLFRLAGAATAAILLARLSGWHGGLGWTILIIVSVWAMIPAAGPGTAVVGAVTAWSLGTGFLSHRAGDLAFAPADRRHLAAFVAAALAAAALSRWAGRRRPVGGPAS